MWLVACDAFEALEQWFVYELCGPLLRDGDIIEFLLISLLVDSC